MVLRFYATHKTTHAHNLNNTGKICMLVLKRLNKEDKILHLLHDADNYRLNVTSLQETHLKEENFTSNTSPRGNKFVLCNSKGSTTLKNQCFGRFGFLFDEQLQVTIKIVSDRICYLSAYIDNRQ